MSLAIPQPDTGHATPFLEPLSFSLSFSPSFSHHPRAPGVMSTTRHATHRSEASRLSSEEGVSIKEITKRIFASAAERIAMTRTVSRLRLSLTKRDTAEPLVNNVVFNIVLYGIALYDLYTASRLINFEHIENEPRIP